MKHAADFRKHARASLRGKWAVAISTAFLASLFGAGVLTNTGVLHNASTSMSRLQETFQIPEIWTKFQPALIAAIVIAVIWLLITFIIGGALKLGYAVFNLKLIDHREVSVSDLFSQFHRLGDGFCMKFFMSLLTFFWTLLFIIPGMIKEYSYAMTPYILAENPEMTALEAITESRRLMTGKKWRLFCLNLSFIGWEFLCDIPTMIATAILLSDIAGNGIITALYWLIPGILLTFMGNLFLMPYQEAAHAAFYREL